MDYNIVVIGGGSAGLVSAYIAAALKARVALIERHRMGGDCLNTGCVPSKALIRTASLVSMVRRHKAFGLRSATVEFDFAEVMERVQRVIRKIEPHDSVERYTSLGVECFTGHGEIVSPHEVRVGDRTLTTKNIIVATGAAPFIPPISGLEAIDFLHTDNIWDIREKPQRLVVLGGGPIGCELAQCFQRLGSDVTQVEMAPQILGREDEEIIRLLTNRFTDEGIDLRVGTKAVEVESGDSGTSLVVEENGRRDTIQFDKILVAVGRKPNTAGFGLEEVGVTFTSRGAVATDAYGRTSMPNIFACGDVASPYQFTHMAAHGAWYCAVNALFSPVKKFREDLSVVPWCTYTDPEIARVGLNEKDARERGIAYEVSRYDVDDLDRAITDEEDYGIVKVLTPPGKDTILGVTICSYHAGDLLPEYISAMKHGLGLNAILNTIHVYPTMAEANKFAAGVWKKAHAPQKVLAFLEWLHRFRRG